MFTRFRLVKHDEIYRSENDKCKIFEKKALMIPS